MSSFSEELTMQFQNLFVQETGTTLVVSRMSFAWRVRCRTFFFSFVDFPFFPHPSECSKIFPQSFSLDARGRRRTLWSSCFFAAVRMIKVIRDVSYSSLLHHTRHDEFLMLFSLLLFFAHLESLPFAFFVECQQQHQSVLKALHKTFIFFFHSFFSLCRSFSCDIFSAFSSSLPLISYSFFFSSCVLLHSWLVEWVVWYHRSTKHVRLNTAHCTFVSSELRLKRRMRCVVCRTVNTLGTQSIRLRLVLIFHIASSHAIQWKWEWGYTFGFRAKKILQPIQ